MRVLVLLLCLAACAQRRRHARPRPCPLRGKYDICLRKYDIANDIDKDEFGNIYITGGSYDGFITEENYVTIKYDTSGNQKWIKEYDNSFGTDISYDLVVDKKKNANVYITGGSYDGFITERNYVTIKYDSTGNQIWQKNMIILLMMIMQLQLILILLEMFL